MQASIIDYPREKLAEDIWDDANPPKLLSEISDEILDIVYSYLDDTGIPEDALLDIFVYGSILSNQYNSKTDVDARILLDSDIIYSEFGEGIDGDALYELGKEQIHDILLVGTEHPFNATVVIEGEDTVLGQSELGALEETPLYSVLGEEFVVDPYYEDSDFDPDEALADSHDEAKAEMEVLDALLTELKSDTIDYDWIQEALGGVEDKGKFRKKLQSKLEEIEADAVALAVKYTEIRDGRYGKGKEHSDPGNVLYKILEKYQYIDSLKEIKSIVDGGLGKKDVSDLMEAVQ